MTQKSDSSKSSDVSKKGGEDREVFCTHLDTACRITDARAFLWELLLTRLFAGIPVVTDTMLIDTAATHAIFDEDRNANSQYDVEILKSFVDSGQLICLRRNAPSFQHVLGKMLLAGKKPMKFSSLPLEHNALAKDVRNHPDVENAPAEKKLFVASRIFTTRLAEHDYASFKKYLDWIDATKLRIDEWPQAKEDKSRARLVVRVKNGLDFLKEKGNGFFDPRHPVVADFAAKLSARVDEEDEDFSRTEMWELLGFRTGHFGDLDPNVRRCVEIVDGEYLGTFPERKEQGTLHRVWVPGKEQHGQLGTHDQHIISHFIRRPAHIIGKEKWLSSDDAVIADTDQFNALLEHAKNIAPLATILDPDDPIDKTEDKFNSFVESLRQICKSVPLRSSDPKGPSNVHLMPARRFARDVGVIFGIVYGVKVSGVMGLLPGAAGGALAADTGVRLIGKTLRLYNQGAGLLRARAHSAKVRREMFVDYCKLLGENPRLDC